MLDGAETLNHAIPNPACHHKEEPAAGGTGNHKTGLSPCTPYSLHPGATR
jgi:hypothetical protein